MQCNAWDSGHFDRIILFQSVHNLVAFLFLLNFGRSRYWAPTIHFQYTSSWLRDPCHPLQLIWGCICWWMWIIRIKWIFLSCLFRPQNGFFSSCKANRRRPWWSPWPLLDCHFLSSSKDTRVAVVDFCSAWISPLPVKGHAAAVLWIVVPTFSSIGMVVLVWGALSLATFPWLLGRSIFTSIRGGLRK